MSKLNIIKIEDGLFKIEGDTNDYYKSKETPLDSTSGSLLDSILIPMSEELIKEAIAIKETNGSA